MMYYVYTVNGIAREIINDYDPVFPGIPIDKRYNRSFVDKCIPVNDDCAVSIGDEYDPITNTFSTPLRTKVESLESILTSLLDIYGIEYDIADAENSAKSIGEKIKSLMQAKDK